MLGPRFARRGIRVCSGVGSCPGNRSCPGILSCCCDAPASGVHSRRHAAALEAGGLGLGLAVLLLVLPAPSARAQDSRFERLHRMVLSPLDRASAMAAAGTAWAQDLALADADGDGLPDAFVANTLWQSGAQNRLYLNDGTGRFVDATAQLPPDTDNTASISMGDLDGDGDLDLLLENSWQDKVYRNLGPGVFLEAPRALPPTQGSSNAGFLALADVDGDLDLDAFLDGVGGLRLYGNDGSAAFTDRSADLPPGLPGAVDLVARDLDEDGDVDARLGVNRRPDVPLRNDGSGRFDALAGVTPQEWVAAATVAAGDVDGDGDGDPDVIEGRGFEILAVSNLRRHLAWREFPRVGNPLILDLWGAPGGFWSLWASASLAPGAGFGGWWLARPWVPGGRGRFDGQGRSTASWIVPDRPEYVGLTLYWQAGLLEPRPALTNVETTTFAGV